VVLSQHADEAYAFQLLKDGTAGLAYLLKERVGDTDELLRALRETIAGRSVIDPVVVEALLARRGRLAHSPLATLTPRETDVVREMAKGKTNAAIAAMIGNQLDVMEVSAAPVIGADVNGNVDLVMIASALNHPILGLDVTTDITTADQLKGKVIASGPPGSPVDYSAKVSLSLLGLKPSDVALRSIGTAAEITAAMLSGQVPAGMVAPPQSFQVETKGFHLLKNIFSQPYQNVALVARRSRLDELAPRLRPVLAAYRDGIAAIYDKQDQAIKVLDQFAKVGNPDILKKTYDFYTNPSFAPFQKDMQPTTEGIQAMIDFLAESSPNIKGHKPAEFVDLRLLKDLPK
jgi:ABC-type nitrate/sulfonate/bicarbonate transport system substrate-binding protein